MVYPQKKLFGWSIWRFDVWQKGWWRYQGLNCSPMLVDTTSISLFDTLYYNFLSLEKLLYFALYRALTCKLRLGDTRMPYGQAWSIHSVKLTVCISRPIPSIVHWPVSLFYIKVGFIGCERRYDHLIRLCALHWTMNLINDLVTVTELISSRVWLMCVMLDLFLF